MKIEFENIILRDMIESDIENYVRWFTTETKWSDTDAPWEPVESDEETERNSWREYYEAVKDIPDVLETHVTVKTDKMPVRVYLAPSREALDFTYESGRVSYTVPRFNCSALAVIEF